MVKEKKETKKEEKKEPEVVVAILVPQEKSEQEFKASKIQIVMLKDYDLNIANILKKGSNPIVTRDLQKKLIKGKYAKLI